MKSTDHNPDRDKPFNKSVNFCESQHEVTQAEREDVQNRIAAMINQTKKEISNERHQ